MRQYLETAVYREQIISLFWSHLYLAFVPVLLAVVIALPLGWLVHRDRTATAFVLGASSIVYTIPSLALFIALPPLIGTSFTSDINIILGLTIYTVALMLRGVVSALDALSAPVLDAATAMGFKPVRRAVVVELPMAIPVLVASLRVAVVSNVSLVSIGALLGNGGLGELLTFGFRQNYLPPQIVGVVLIALIALVADAVIVGVQRVATPWLRVGSDA